MRIKKKRGFLSLISFFLLFLDMSEKHLTTFRGPTTVCLRRKRQLQQLQQLLRWFRGPAAACLRRKRRKRRGKINRGKKIRIRNHLDIIEFPSRKVDTK